MSTRRAILWTALLVAAGLAIFGNRSPTPDIAQPTRLASIASPATQQRASTSQRIADEQLLVLLPRGGASMKLAPSPLAMFGHKSWAPPPPAPVRVVEKPTAPPMPYQYVGKKWEDGQWTIFLAKEDVTLLVKVGDVLEDTYRVQSIDATRLTLSYLPLKEEQTIAID